MFLDWIGITEIGFNYLLDQHRNKSVWKRNDQWEWETSFPDFNSKLTLDLIDNARLEITDTNNKFELTKERISSDQIDKYILIGKGVM